MIFFFYTLLPMISKKKKPKYNYYKTADRFPK